jgi:tetratricopeptide (TPR) repeat protein
MFLAALTLAAPAFADDARDQARKAFAAGEAAYNLSHFDEALQKYEEAYRLSHVPALLFNIGQVHRRLFEDTRDLEHGRKAREAYQAYLREVPMSPQETLVKQLLAEVDKKYAEEVHARREKLLADATGPGALKYAEDLYDQKYYEDAVFALNKFFRTPRNSRADLVKGYVLAARVALATGNEAQARQAMARALALDPSVEPPPSVGPEIHRVYDAARKELEGKGVLAVKHTARGDVAPGQLPTIRVDVIADPLRMIQKLVLHYRSGGSLAYSEVESSEPGALVLPKTLSSGLRSGTKIEYYIDAVDESGGILQSLGTAEGPFAINVREDRPFYKSWWFWGVAGAVAVGTTVAIAAAHQGPFQDGPQVLIDHP